MCAKIRVGRLHVACRRPDCSFFVPEDQICELCDEPYCLDHLVVRVFVDSGEVIEKEAVHCIDCERERSWT